MTDKCRKHKWEVQNGKPQNIANTDEKWGSADGQPQNEMETERKLVM